AERPTRAASSSAAKARLCACLDPVLDDDEAPPQFTGLVNESLYLFRHRHVSVPGNHILSGCLRHVSLTAASIDGQNSRSFPRKPKGYGCSDSAAAPVTIAVFPVNLSILARSVFR